MIKGHITISINTETNEKATKYGINKSKICEKALKKEIEKHEGKITKEISIENAFFYANLFSKTEQIINKQKEHYQQIHNSILELSKIMKYTWPSAKKD